MMSRKCRPMFRRTCVVLPRSLLFLRWEEVVLRFALLLLHFALLFSYWLMILALLVPHCQVGSLPSLLHNAHVVPWFLCEHVCIGLDVRRVRQLQLQVSERPNYSRALLSILESVWRQSTSRLDSHMCSRVPLPW